MTRFWLTVSALFILAAVPAVAQRLAIAPETGPAMVAQAKPAMGPEPIPLPPRTVTNVPAPKPAPPVTMTGSLGTEVPSPKVPAAPKPAENVVRAENKAKPAAPSPYPERSPGESQMTIESRYYELAMARQAQQDEAVHQAAIARAEQRTRRLESRRWFGLSNARPQVSSDPLNGDYAPGWVSNCPWYPMRWIGAE